MIPSLDKTRSIVSQQESRDSNIFGRIPEERERGARGQTVWVVFPTPRRSADFLLQSSSSRQRFEILS